MNGWVLGLLSLLRPLHLTYMKLPQILHWRGLECGGVLGLVGAVAKVTEGLVVKGDV